MSEIELQMRRVISEVLGLDESVIIDQSRFYEDLGIDSLDFFELMSVIEKTFNLSIDEERYDQLKTVGGLVSYVKANVKLVAG